MHIKLPDYSAHLHQVCSCTQAKGILSSILRMLSNMPLPVCTVHNGSDRYCRRQLSMIFFFMWKPGALFCWGVCFKRVFEVCFALGGGLWNILHDFFDFAMKDRAEHLDCVGTYAFIPLHTGYLAWTHIEFMNQRILSYSFMTHGFP